MLKKVAIILIKDVYYKIIAPFMKDGLTTSKGDKWRNRRH
uniref:Uncharacterized protein n=1 Tax=Tetranychus urticae TaxID=32264 RepID=T1JYM4_TETUR